MRLSLRLATALTALAAATATATAAEPVRLPPAADMVIEWLRFGNERHREGRYVHWHVSPDRRREVALAERPHAIVLTCSDSRVPPELLFDQGIGDLFVVRVLGNVAGEKELASIEYAADQLGAPVIVVLGHQRCQIVEKAVLGGALPAGHLGSIVASMSPAVARARMLPGDPVEEAGKLNVQSVVEQLRTSEPVLGKLWRAGKVKLTGAYYNMDTGDVTWLPGER